MNSLQKKKVIKPLYSHWKQMSNEDLRNTLLDFKEWCSRGSLIINKQGHAVPFELNEAQRKVAELILSKAFAPIPEPVTLVIHKSRQMGISVLLAALEQYLVDRKQNLNITHLFPDEQLASQFFNEKWQPLAESRHPQLLPDMYPTVTPVPYVKVGDFHGINMNCNIKIGGAGSPAAGRSATNHIVIMDEYAFYPNVKSLERGILATQPKTGLVLTIYVSTANGANWFYDACKQAEKSSRMEHLFLPWHMLKEYEMDVTPNSRFYNLDLYKPTEYDLKLMDIFEKTGYPPESWLRKLEWYDHTLEKEAKGDRDFMASEYPSCVVAGTRVGTEDGIIRIEDAYEGIEATLGRVSRTHRQPKSPIAKLTTRCGYEVSGTYDHPVKTPEGFVPLIDMVGKTAKLLPPKTAESLYTESWKTYGVSHSIDVTEELAEWLGYFLGDGSFSGNTIDFALCLRDRDVIDRIKFLTNSIFGVELNGRISGSKKGGYNLRAGAKQLGETLKRLGVIETVNGYTHRKIVVPECVWRSPLKIQGAFLRGLFEADGYIGATGVRSGYVKFFGKDKDFVKDVQLLLLAQGIVSYRRQKVKRGHEKEYPGCELSLSSIATQEFKKIGFIGAFKNERLKNTFSGQNARPMKMEDEVVSVTPCGEDYTYNLTVPGPDTFDANGVWTHNTPEESFESTGRPCLPAKIIRYWIDKNQNDKLIFVDQFSQTDKRTRRPKVVIAPTDKSAVRMFHPPLPGHRYMLACDPSEGDYAGDRSAFVVVDIKTMEEVCFSADYLEAEELADALLAYAKYYNSAMIVVERNMGQAVIEFLKMSGYYRLYVDPTSSSLKYGVRTTQATKNEGLRRLKFLLNNGFYKPHDPLFLEEAQHFSWKQLPGGSWRVEATGTDENGQPYHDDTAMARVVLCLALDMKRFNGYYTDSKTKKLL